MQFKVTEKYARGGANPIAQFYRQDDAIFFIENKLQRDFELNTAVTYGLLDPIEMIAEFPPLSEGSASSGGQSSQYRSPSPLQTVPRPAGIPLSSFKDADDQDKK